LGVPDRAPDCRRDSVGARLPVPRVSFLSPSVGLPSTHSGKETILGFAPLPRTSKKYVALENFLNKN